MLQNGALEPIAYSLAGQAIANHQMKVPSREPTPNTGSGTSVDRSDVLKDVNSKKSEGNPSK